MRQLPTKIVKESRIMEEEYESGHMPTPKDICDTVDCSECPFFLRIDICGYETATNLYF